DLLAPLERVRREPELVHSVPVAIETKLPRAIEIQPVVAFDCPALPFRTRILRTWIEELRGHGLLRIADCGLRNPELGLRKANSTRRRIACSVFREAIGIHAAATSTFWSSAF